jgi:hypothetical protein
MPAAASCRPGRVIAGKLVYRRCDKISDRHDQAFAFRDTAIGLLHEFGFVLR